MKGRTAFGIVGWTLFGLAILAFLLRAVLRVKTGTDWPYLNYKFQPMTYLGALATLAIAGLVGIVGLYYRLKRVLQERQDQKRRVDQSPRNRTSRTI